MPDKRIETLRAHYANIDPEVAELLRQANELVPQKPGRDRHSLSLEARDQFREAVKAFRQGPATKDTIMRLWETRYNALGPRVGLTFEVPDLNYYQDEIIGLSHMDPARKLVYVPDELFIAPRGLVSLSRMYPKMRSWVDKPDTALAGVTYPTSQGGWRHIEAGWETPNINTTQLQLETVLKGLNESYPSYIWKGQGIVPYIIGAQDSRDLTGHYFDEQGWARLLGSFVAGEVLLASFHSPGRLSFLWRWGPLNHRPDLGGRFEGAKP